MCEHKLIMSSLNEINQYNNNVFYNIYRQQSLVSKYERYLLLRISISKSLPNYNTVLNEYLTRAREHNHKILNDFFLDAGFNLLLTDELNTAEGSSYKVDFGVKCAATMITDNKAYPSGFYMYPRSSTGSKTGLRLANSVGIIDAGYRGNLMGVFDSRKVETISSYSSIVQICGPSLVPIWVDIVDDLDENTERGAGGFGSTGV